VPVGAPLAALAQEGDPKPVRPEIPPETAPATRPETPEIAPEPTPVPDTEAPETVPMPPEIEPPVDTVDLTATSRPKITPAARRLAAQTGLDLGTLTSDPDKIITRQHIENLAAIAADPHEGPTVTTGVKPDSTSEMRKAIAAAMTRSKREIPHYYLAHLVDLTAADTYLTSVNANRQPDARLLMGILTARAIALALTKYPEFNGHYDADGFRPADAVHLGIAIHIRTGGLVAPALFDVESRKIDDLMAGLNDLVTRVRAGRFKARELSDATITMTSLGARGVDQVTGVIYPPQVAIVGVGTPRLTPAVHDGQVKPRLTTSLTLAADHRVSDGHRGALFLKAIDTKLQEPDTL
jgi:pyruvate dehydrogenase E2 component (dihydrolipoamide acetyltransferase)